MSSHAAAMTRERPTERTEILTTKQVRALSGASLRQLQHWDESGILMPYKTLWRREYSPDEALKAMIFTRLRKAHLSMKVIRRRRFQVGEDVNYLAIDGRAVLGFETAERLLTYLCTSGFKLVFDVAAARTAILTVIETE